MSTMAKAPPSNVTFLLCEDIRQEAGNKVSLLGLYTGDGVFIPAGEFTGKAQINSLCVFARFLGGAGEFKQRIKVESAGGKVTEVIGPTATLEAGKPHMVHVQMRPFPVDALGTYKLTIYFDELEFTYSFFVNEGEQPSD